MTSIMRLLKKWATGRTVLPLFLVTMAVYLTMLLYTLPAVEGFAPGKTLFDLSPTGYSYEDALSLLTALGAEGRHRYLTVQLPLDLLYPGLFAVSYSLLLTWLFALRFKPDSKIFFFAVTPVLGGLFDYLENCCIIAMLRTFPDVPRRLVQAASTFTILKSAFTTVFFILLFIGILLLLRKKPLAR